MAGNEKWILLLTHGRLCEAILESASMIAGTLDAVHTIPLVPGLSPERYLAEVEEVLEKAPAGSYIVTDIYGGTPCNIARMLLRKYDVQAFSGLSLAMLLELDSLRRETRPAESLAEELLSLSGKSPKYLNALL